MEDELSCFTLLLLDWLIGTCLRSSVICSVWLHCPPQDRTGQVSAFELRNVLGAYGVNLPESGFRCLMEQLDPRGRGMLRYSEFLEFFTPKVPEVWGILRL